MVPQDKRTYQLRQATEQDKAFLYELHVSALKEYVEATWGWDETWQYNYFHNNFKSSRYQIVVVRDEDVGVVSIEERDGELYLALIELKPSHQKMGLGTTLIRDFTQLAHDKKLAATLEVLRANKPAKRLYERLGFQVIGEDKYKFSMANPP